MTPKTKEARDTAAEPALLDDPLIRCLSAAVLERNGREAVLLDLRRLSDATDCFLIATGDSDTHARAIADNVLERCKEAGFRPVGIEGRAGGDWILMDYVSAVVHIFLPRVREYYQLETLWGDAPSLSLE
ncbi:MAG: ribosome silencing factor [Gemmatimonadota bacterium]